VATSDILALCRQNGYKVNEKDSIIDGLKDGVAFRVRLAEESIQLSLNLNGPAVQKLCQKLAAGGVQLPAGPPAPPDSADTAGKSASAAVAPLTTGVLLSRPGLATIDAPAFNALLTACAREGAALLGTAYTDKYEKDRREPAWCLLTGVVGALLGAVVGALPYFALIQFAHFAFWPLGFLVSTASFYGYQFLRGAHRTRFAVASVIVCTLLAVIGLQTLLWWWGYQAIADIQAIITDSPALATSFLLYIQANIANILIALACAGLGLFTIKQRVLAYTHSAWYLRRR